MYWSHLEFTPLMGKLLLFNLSPFPFANNFYYNEKYFEVIENIPKTYCTSNFNLFKVNRLTYFVPSIANDWKQRIMILKLQTSNIFWQWFIWLSMKCAIQHATTLFCFTMFNTKSM
jgi:hypothetical protein